MGDPKDAVERYAGRKDQGREDDTQAAKSSRKAMMLAGQKAGASKGAARGYALGLERGWAKGLEKTFGPTYRRNYAAAFEEAGLEKPANNEIKVPKQ